MSKPFPTQQGEDAFLTEPCLGILMYGRIDA